MNRPILYIFAGLPGVGKSTLAQKLSAETGAAYLRIDTIEQSYRDLCGITVYAEGYQTAYRLAADNLQIGTSVVADSCNAVEVTRREWLAVAQRINGSANGPATTHAANNHAATNRQPGNMLPNTEQSATARPSARLQKVIALNIEVICSDKAEHQMRVERRSESLQGFRSQPWDEIINREYHAWTQHRLVLDTAGETAEDSFSRLLSLLDTGA